MSLTPPAWLRRFSGYCWTHLIGTSTPVWWTFLAVIAGVVGTYHFTPKLNAKFETAKIKAQYVSDNLKTLNTDTSELIVSVRVFNHSLADKADAKVLEPSRLEVANRITRLRWKAVELSMIAEKQEEKDIVLNYNKALDVLSKSIGAATSSDDIGAINEAVKSLLDRTFIVLRFLAVKADLRISLFD